MSNIPAMPILLPWPYSSIAAVLFSALAALVAGYQVSSPTTADLAISAQSSDSWNPSLYTVEPCPIGTYYNAAATDFKCTACPHGSVSRNAGALSVDECMVPPGYFIATDAGGQKSMVKCPTSSDPATAGYFRSSWVSYSQVVSADAAGTDVCTKCGDGILSELTEADENPLAADDSRVAATSASCCK